jgi:hypothetical protein
MPSRHGGVEESLNTRISANSRSINKLSFDLRLFDKAFKLDFIYPRTRLVDGWSMEIGIRVWNQSAVACLKVLSWHSLGEAEKDNET